MSGNEKENSAEKNIKKDDPSEKSKFYDSLSSKFLRSRTKSIPMDVTIVDDFTKNLLQTNNRIPKYLNNPSRSHTKNKEENSNEFFEFQKQYNNWNLPYDIFPNKYKKIPLYEKMKYNTLKSLLKFNAYVERYVIIKNKKDIFQLGKIKSCNKNKIINIALYTNDDIDNENEITIDISNYNSENVIYLVELSFFLKENNTYVLIVSNFITKEFLITRNEKDNIIYSGFIIDNK